MVIVWLIVATLAATFVAESAFMLLYSAQRALKADALLFEARMIAYLWLVIGYPADIVVNLTRATIMFRELPRELLFSSRIQRLVRSDSEWRRKKALSWAQFLNSIDEGHIEL